MEDIRVGEYIRTIHGIIGKVIDRISREYLGKVIIDATYRIDVRKEDYSYKTVDLSQIKKHSFELKELLEKGDYVNGIEIDEFDDVEGTMYLGFPIYDDSLMDTISEFRPLETIEIQDIVTKEQFDREKYVVEVNNG